MDSIWLEYLDALERCTKAVKLAVYHTKVVVKETDKTATLTLLTAYYVKECLNNARNRDM